MSKYDDLYRLNRLLDRMERRLPGWLMRILRWLRAPTSRWVRLPLGIFLIAGGLLAILPVFGLWMLPFGFLLLALDVPLLRRPARRGTLCIERRYLRWSRERRARREMDR